MNKLINRILIISSLFLIVTIGAFIFLLKFNEPERLVCGTETPESICGTTPENLSENGRIGKQIFNANCASCHKLNKNMTGPALAKTDSTILWNWMTLNNKRIDSSKFNELRIDYHRKQWSESISSTQLLGLYEYINAD